jgi:hypothetical protein
MLNVSTKLWANVIWIFTHIGRCLFLLSKYGNILIHLCLGRYIYTIIYEARFKKLVLCHF